MQTDSKSLKSIDLEELSRRRLIELSSALIETLEEARQELSESVRCEVEQKFVIAELKKKLNNHKGEQNV